MSNFTFKAITGKKNIQNTVDQIKLDSQNTVFASGSWLRNLINDNNISFTAQDQNGQVAHALHLNLKRKFGFCIAEMAGEPFTQYSDAINHNQQSIDDFLKICLAHLADIQCDALHLRNVRADAHIIEYCQANGRILAKKQAPWVDLTQFENYEAYFNSLSKTTKKTYRRLFRELDTQFNVYLDDEITRELIDEIIELKSMQLDDHGKSSRVFADLQNLKQLSTILTTQTSDFNIFVSTIRCGGTLASAAISFIRGERYYGYIVTMDNNFIKYKPGNIHVILNIEYAYNHGITSYDFLSPADEYKYRWSKNNSIAVYDILLPMNAKGKLYGSVYLNKLRPRLKSLYLYMYNSRLYKVFKK
ncbi:MAG: GNAT family N-acetyltransferase [Alphaproteobacteria bacterium]|nr:GNAT family N-acetyltransferase [Alphaproteobacteria bacterium]